MYSKETNAVLLRESVQNESAKVSKEIQTFFPFFAFDRYGGAFNMGEKNCNFTLLLFRD